ncbi:MAG: polysaccharide pyruvyl transferase family protein [Acidobacteriota bacterium]
MRITIAGPSVYGLNNLSDDAMLTVFTRGLREAVPEAEFVLLARHPGPEVDEAFGVKSTPNLDHANKKSSLGRWFRGLNAGDSTDHLRRIADTIGSSDLLVIGADPFLEVTLDLYRGPAPYAALLVTLAKFLGIPVMFLGIHVGRPLQTEYGRQIARFCAGNASLVTVREEFSKRVLETLGLTGENIVALADPAFGLAPGTPQQALLVLEKESIPVPARPLIGVTFRHMYWKWNQGDWNFHSRTIAAVCDALVEKAGADILFIPHCTYDLDHKYEDDRPAAEEIVRQMRRQDRAFQIKGRHCVDAMVSLFSLLSLVIANRRHSVIFGAIHGIPGVGIGEAWHMTPFMDELGLSEFFIPYDEFGPGKLESLCLDAWVKRATLSDRLRPVLPALRQKAREHSARAADLVIQRARES